MILHSRPNLSSYLFIVSLLLNACGPVTPMVQPVISTIPPTVTETTSTLAPVDPSLEPITPQNVDRLEQIDRLGTGEIYDFAVSPDQGEIALYVNNEIYIYDAKTLVMQQTVSAGAQFPIAWHSSEREVVFAPDGQTFAFTSNSGVRIWDLSTNTLARRFSSLIPEWEVVNLEFSPDGARMVVTTLGGSARCDGRDMNFALYDLQGHLLFDRYHCADYSSNSYHFTSDGKVFFSLSSIMTGIRPGEAYLVDVQTGEVVVSSRAVYSDDYEQIIPQELLYEVSPDGKTLAYMVYGDAKPVTKLVDARTQNVLQTVNGQIKFFLQDGKTSWRPASPASSLPETVVLEACEVENDHMADEYQLVSANKDSAVLAFSHFGQIESLELWDLDTCEISKTLSFPIAEKTTFSPNGRWLAASDGYHAYIWDMKTGKLHLTIPGKAFESPKDIIQFNADGTRFLASSMGRDYISPKPPYRNYTISVYDVETGVLVREIKPETEFLYSILATPDRDIILVDDSLGRHFWNIETGQLMSNIPSGPYVFNPNSSQIWTVEQTRDDGKVERKIVLIDYKTGKTIREIVAIEAPWIRGLYLDSDAQRIMVHVFLGQGKDKGDAVSILNTETGKRLTSYHLPWNDHELTAYGDRFATNGTQGYIHLWNYEEDIPYLVSLGDRTNRKVNDYYDDSFEFNSFTDARLVDEHMLLTTGPIRFWDTESGILLTELSLDYSFAEIVFSPDKRLIAVTGTDGLIRLWGVREP